MSRCLTDHLAIGLTTLPGETPLCVAYSGGPDSTALLHGLAHLPQARARGLRALHVDHQLHPDSAQWAQHCARVCSQLDVPLETIRVQIAHGRGEGLEAAARHARRAAFAQSLQPGEWLTLAHHRDDQIETVLLKLLRGAGPLGLAGMRERRPFASGALWRPLLALPRAVLREYAIAHDLACIEDPSNKNMRLSRNFLRAEILPRLSQHWPQTGQSILHAAALCRAAAEHLDAQASAALDALRIAGGDMLDAPGWSSLPDALRALVLERWLHGQGLPAPTQVQLAELRRQATEARVDQVPSVTWPGVEVRVWRGALHAMAPAGEIPEKWETTWRGESLQLPGGGALVLVDANGNPGPHRLDPPLKVRLRRGGERIKPAGDAHTRELRHLLQGAGIPPWQRARIPLVSHGDELIAVADLWCSGTGRALFQGVGAHPRWLRAD